MDEIRRFKIARPSAFIICCVHDDNKNEHDARLRLELFHCGTSMVTTTRESADMMRALGLVARQTAGPFACVYCGLKLTEDDLWLHYPLHHVNEKNITVKCPVCNTWCDPDDEPFPVHLQNRHGPCADGRVVSEYNHKPNNIYAFALIVCINDGKILLVQEFASSGMWLPGGRVDTGESLQHAGIRECIEEAGIEVVLEGVLKLQYNPSPKGHVRLRVVFLARPKSDSWKTVKTIPDFESAGAIWVDFDHVEDLASRRLLRGSEPLEWTRYLRAGGLVHPMSVLGREQ